MTTPDDRHFPSSPDPHHDFSLDRVRRLVTDLEQELANAPPDLPNMQALKEEIETLKHVLAASEGQEGLVKEKLHSVRGTLQDMTARVENEVLKDTPYIAEIGRILGLV
jgi:hypothetical protein